MGVFLSGGIDSTLVAALSAEDSPDPIKTFSVGYDTGSVNETSAASRVADLIGAEHHELVVTEREIASRLPSIIRELDQPLADEALVPLRLLAEFARPDVTVAVGGEGADETFGGYPRYRWLARSAGLHERVPRHVLSGIARVVETMPRLGRASRLRDVLVSVSLVHRHINWVTDGRPGLRASLYGSRLTRFAERDEFAERVEELVGCEVDRGIEAAFMRLDQLHWLPGDVLMKADWATMRASLEFRTPFLGRELAEFAATVPARLHVQEGGKLLLRRVLREVLPQAAHYQPKIAFRTPASDWLRGPLWPVLSEQLRSGSLFSEAWFDQTAVSSLAERHRSGRADWSHVLWPILVLGIWLDDLLHGTCP